MESTNWMALLERAQIQKVMESNQYTEQYGLTLSAQDAEVLAQERKSTLMEQKRVEFGESILPRIIYEFCDSAFISQSNYVESLVRLQEIFFLYKNEMLDEISDEELLNFMKEQFETVCFGDFDYLEGTCLDILHRRSGQDTAVIRKRVDGVNTRRLTRCRAGTRNCIWKRCGDLCWK